MAKLRFKGYRTSSESLVLASGRTLRMQMPGAIRTGSAGFAPLSSATRSTCRESISKVSPVSKALESGHPPGEPVLTENITVG